MVASVVDAVEVASALEGVWSPDAPSQPLTDLELVGRGAYQQSYGPPASVLGQSL